MARNLSKHAEWLSLVEVSGPFLAVAVLDRVFPQGLEAIYPESKRRIRSAYEEWCDAVSEDDKDLQALHKEWVHLVIFDFLEIPDKVLLPGYSVQVPSDNGVGGYSPEFVLQDEDDKPKLFVGVYPPGTNLAAIDRRSDWTASPLDKMTKLCRVKDVRLGLLTNGEEWMLVNAPNGKTSGSVTWYARLWFQEPRTLQAFSSLLGVRRFFGPENETLPALMDESLDCLEEVTDTLGDQVRTAVEVLIQGLDKADQDRNRELLRDIRPAELYEAGLTVMMRLVFLLCAEERGLLLLGTELYDQNYAVSTLRSQLASEADKHGAEILERRHDAWARLLAIFRAVYGGLEHVEVRLPALGGSIFDPDKYPFLEGRAKGTCWKECNPTPLPIDNRTVLLLLNSLQVLEQAGGAILLSYRALDVEQIGHIYEGLLEHTAARTPEITLGLRGSAKAKNPNITLPELESLALESEKKLFDRIKDITGRSPAAIKNAYNKTVDAALLDKLSAVCGADRDLVERILPYANLLRKDAWEQPLVYQKGSFMVTLGQDRRESGTHYTPKILTEKIVKTTLEPVVYIGPAEGKERKDWQLKTPAELLNLKICDPAMGSGAFLVQVCRYLADRLYEAWEQAEKAGKFINTEGVVCEIPPKEKMSEQIDDRINAARRLIAEKCLYGVDINPLAVELAKLSIWLVTISKGRPFGFLDHNLKSGDSLLGIHDINQLRELKMKPDGTGYAHLFGKDITGAIDEVLKLREQIRSVPIRDITDVQYMERLNSQAQASLVKVKLLADLFIGEVFSFKGRESKLQETLDLLSTDAAAIMDGKDSVLREYHAKAQQKLDENLPIGKPHRHPFHWAIEFPEVFHNGGFDAICGNPPFSGGRHLTGTLGTAYRNYLMAHVAGINGSADLVAYFYLNNFDLLKSGGFFGLIACNTIAEGDTRQVGLERLLKQGATIIAADPNMPWPGKAAVVISPVHLGKDIEWLGKCVLNGNEVGTISAFLSAQEEWSPKVLKANSDQSFQGSIVLGLGFTMSEAEAQAFIAKDPKNKEVLFPYLNGDDLNSDPEQKPSRWVINFFDWPLDRDADGCWATATEQQKNQYFKVGRAPADYPGRVVTDFPDLYAWVDEKVRPERQRLNARGEYALRRPLPIRWWQYADKRPALYHAIGRGAPFAKHPAGWIGDTRTTDVLAITLHTKNFQPCLVSNSAIFSHAMAIFSLSDDLKVAILYSSIMQSWVWNFGSSIGMGLRFTPSDCYETFPFPPSPASQTEQGKELSAGGYLLHIVRQNIMRDRHYGLTQLYNDFHNPDCETSGILRMRDIQKSIDYAVLSVYGWQGINLEHDFYPLPYLSANDNIRYTISESARIEILRRLAVLNKKRFEEEEKGK